VSPEPGRHTVPLGSTASAGHVSFTPSHDSATSQSPAAGRHTAVLLASAGQLGPLPVQLSVRSQGPADGRQTVLLDWKPSGGHAVFTPSQFSATSQTPAEGRHSVPELPAGC
jgi:hypothetical protein